MESPNENQPLTNDPAREATAPLRGYWAQIWRSVLVWLELGDTERLYLEGAEDIDRVSGLDAETVQVKDVSGSITLRSADVVDAIGNAWAHQQRNARHTVKFRFLTTSSAGVEQGSPFGKGVSGIELWNRARVSQDAKEREAHARQIATFLLAEGKISVAVRAFLESATDGDIWTKLVEPTEWDTDAEKTPIIVQEIKDRLVVFGQRLGITPAKAESVADHLYAYAFETATRQKERFLTRAELLRILHAETSTAVPDAALNALLAAIPQHLVPSGAVSVALGAARSTIGRPTPLPSRYYRRSGVLSDVADRLEANAFLVLQGGTGVGKSTIAADVTANSVATWGWVDLRGMRDAQLTSGLERAYTELEVEDGLSHIVLDDIELPLDARVLEPSLVRLRQLLAQRNGRLIVTSVAALPQRLALAMELAPGGIVPIPPFTHDEIVEFLVSRGCSTPQAGILATFVELHTRGHAQLVHARIATLEAQRFPTPNIESALTTPSDVLEARAEAHRLVSALDERTRALVYRLSLGTHALSRNQVLAIAGIPPPIAEPGLALDRLVGPWLETVSEGIHRISPLLSGIGREILGEPWATQMHRDIASALLEFRTLSAGDVSAILLHGTLGQNWTGVAKLSFGILQSRSVAWEALAESASWFLAVGTDVGQRLGTDPFSSLLIRLLQLRLAAMLKDTRAANAIIARIDDELPSNIVDAPLRLARQYFLGQVLMEPELGLPIATVVSMGAEFIRLLDEFKGVLTPMLTQNLGSVTTGLDGTTDMAGLASVGVMSHVIDRESLAGVLDACEHIDVAVARRLLWFMGGSEAANSFILDRVWLAEFNRTSPNWPAALETAQKTYAVARERGVIGLAHAAARMAARILDENLHRPDNAIQLLDAATSDIGPSPGQDDQRAHILLRRDENLQALTIWRALLPAWPLHGEFELQQPFSYRLAAVAAARLGFWSEAADFLRRAWELASEDHQAIFRAGLQIDEAFTRWKSGDNGVALDRLVEGIRSIDQLDPNESDPKMFTLRKIAGHTAMWIANSTTGKHLDGFSEPSPAWASSLEQLDAGLAPTPSHAIWTHVVQFELEAKLGQHQFRLLEEQLKTSPLGLIRLSFDGLRLRQRVRELDFDDLFEVCADLVEALVICQEHYKDGGLTAEQPLPATALAIDRGQLDSETLVTFALNALFAMAARNIPVTKRVLDRWVQSAERAKVIEIVRPWLQFVESLFVNDARRGETEVRDASLPTTWRLTASIRRATNNEASPAELLSIHAFWLAGLPIIGNALYVLDDLVHLVSTVWRRLANDPFLLRNPTVTAPIILQACDNSSLGPRKIAEILLAACDAVPARVSEELLANLRRVALSGSSSA